MKNFAKLLFIIFCFFMSLCTSVQSAEFYNVNKPVDYLSGSDVIPAGEELCIKLQHPGASIVAPIHQSGEITSLKEKKNIFMSGALDRACSQNRLLQQIFNSKYNQQYDSISHNISSYLKSEICARGP